LIDTLLDVGEQLESRAPLLITKDEPVLWVSDLRDRLADYYAINLPSPDIVELLMSKTRFLETAREQGWPVPYTCVVESIDDLRREEHQIPYPCILKPAIKNSAFRAHAPAKAFVATTRSELFASYELVAQWEKEAVIQEWIEGGDDRIAYCLAYYDRAGHPLALFPGRKLRQRPMGCGNTAVAATAPDEWAGPILALSQSIFSTVGFKGLGSIEYKVRANGSLVIMEPTVGRTNWQSEIAVLNGTDIPAAAYFDHIGQAYRPPETAPPRCKLIDGRADFNELRASLRGGRLPLSRWLADRSGRKRYMLWRCSDPAPSLAAKMHFFYRAVRYGSRLPLKIYRRLCVRKHREA
jgi:D-aspartate ligase